MLGVAADASTAEGRQAVLDYVNRHVGSSLDILVNNVGTNIRKSSIDYTDEEVDQVKGLFSHLYPDSLAYSFRITTLPLLSPLQILNTNLKSFFHLTRMLHPHLARAPSASVVLMGSVAGVHGVKSGVPYAMTKAAMTQV